MPILYDTGLEYLHELGGGDASSPRYVYGPDECYCIRKFRCNWDQRFNAVRKLLGFSRLTRSGDPVTGPITGLTRDLAMIMPGTLDNDEMIGTKVTSIQGHKLAEGIGAKETVMVDAIPVVMNVYQEADLEIMFEAVNFPEQADGAITEEWERRAYVSRIVPSADYMMLPGGALNVIKPAGGVLGTFPFNVGKIWPLKQFDVTWSKLPGELYAPSNPTEWMKRIWGDPEDPDAERFLGGVNKTTLFNAYGPGTVLLENAIPVLRKMETIGAGWDIIFTFNLDINQWNRKYHLGLTNPAESGFYFAGTGTVHYDAGSVPDNVAIYNERELNDLFNVADVLP